jgi:YD repeat-containing protein
MKRIMTGIALAIMSLSFAHAADDPMASRYGNTLVIKGPDGKEIIRLYYDAGGTLSTKLPDGKTTKATWKLDGDKICVTQTDPAPDASMAAPQCQPFTGTHKVGDTWDVTRPDGVKLTATLQQGRP